MSFEVPRPDKKSRETILSPETDYTTRLRSLLELPSDVKENIREGLWATADKVAETVLHPGHQQAIATYAHIAEWQMLGNTEDAVPEGIVVAEGLYRDHLEFDPRIPYFDQYLHYLQSELGERGLDQLDKFYWETVEPRKAQIKDTLSDFILGSAEYQMLANFNQPEPTLKEQPLSAFWIQTRQRQIEENVRTAHDIDSDTPLRLNSKAHKDLRGQLFRLAEETMFLPRPETGEEALLRARAYVTPFIAQAFKDETGHAFGGFYLEDGEDLKIKSSTYAPSPEDYAYAFSYTEDAAGVISNRLFTDDPYLQFVAVEFLDAIMQKIIDPRTSNTLEHLLQETREQVAEDTARRLLNSASPNHWFAYEQNREAEFFLRRPQCERLTEDQLYELERWAPISDWKDIFSNRSHITTASELYRGLNTTVGTIETYGPDNFRVPSRLVLAQPAKDLPRIQGNEDMVVRMFSDATPFIPGYTLVSNTDTRYGFIVQPEGDPYHPCEVPVNKDPLHSLAATYEMIGLTELAASLTSQPSLTVAELTELIRDASTYYLPTVTSHYDNDPLLRDYASANQLEDFSKVVRNGKLQTQCTGSALFLKYSLERLFEQASAGIVSGNAVLHNNDARITALGHAQTVFVHNNKRYILDATPAGNLDITPVALKASGYSHPQAKETMQPLRKTKNRLHPVEETLLTKEEKLAKLTGKVFEQLRAFFGQHDMEKTFEHIDTLPSHDPARQIVEMIFQLKNGRMSLEEAEKVVSYIGLCYEADQNARKTLGIDHYTRDFLIGLNMDAYSIRRLYEDED